MAHRSEILAGLDEGPVWLLDIDLGGQVYRVAERRVEVSTTAGHTYVYESGLEPLVVTLSDEPVVDVQVVVLTGADWALQVARGARLDRQPATLRRWWPGQVLEACRVIVEGRTVGPEYGAPGEPLELTVTRDPLDESGMLLDALAVVDVETWPDDHDNSPPPNLTRDEQHEGRQYPLVLGYPGHNDGSPPHGAVPGLLVSSNESSWDASKVLIADRPIQASQARVLNWGVRDSDTRDVLTTEDALGREVSYITFTAGTPSASTLTQLQHGDEVWVGFSADTTYGGGIYGLDGSSVLRGAGDVIEWMLTRHTTMRVDTGRMRAEADALNRYLVDTYIDERIRAWEWLANELLPLVPAVIRQGQEGIYMSAVRWDATALDAVAHLSADRGDMHRSGPLRALRQPIYNEIELRYRGAMNGTTWWSRVAISAEHKVRTHRIQATDDRVHGSYLCRLSQSTYGLRPKTMEALWVWDNLTAGHIVADMAARYALPKRTARYVGGPALESIEPWSVVTVSDEEVHLDGAVALVQQQTLQSSGVVLDLIILDHPAQTVRSIV